MQALGAKRVEAALLADLLEHGPSATDDIIGRTGLRQPEVSVGMRSLRDRGWVDSDPIPRQGKGRPMHKYRLVHDPEEVRKHYLEAGRDRIEQFRGAMQALEESLT